MAKPYIKITAEPEFIQGKKEWTFRFKIPAHGDMPAKWDKVQKTGTKKKAEARRSAEEYRRTLEERINAWEQWEEITLGEYAQRWHEQRENEIAYSTWIKERQQIDQIKASDLGGIPIDEIEPEDIEEQKKKNAKAGWSEDKQRRYIQKVKHITKDAAARRTIRHDPGAVVKDIKAKPKERKNPGAIRVAEMEDKLKEDKKTGYTTALYIALHTGFRRGEILGLQWRDIHFNDRTIKLERQLDASKQIRAPKWDSVGTIPMTAELWEWLEEWQRILWRSTKKADGTDWNGRDPVCAGIKGQYIDPTNFSRWARKYFVEAGWGHLDDEGHYHGYTLHEIRHYMASELTGSGADVESVRAIMRHKDIRTTQGYLHEINDNLKDAMAGLEKKKAKAAKIIAGTKIKRKGEKQR